MLAVVVEWGELAKGALHLGVSQPSVSEAIASLEAALGVRLLDRTAQGITPTLYGLALLKRAEVVFDELKQGVREIAILVQLRHRRGQDRLPDSLAAGFVPAVVERLSRQYPRITAHVVLAQTGEQEFRELRERSVDLLLGRLFKSLRSQDVFVENLCEDRFFVVAGAQSRWARRPDITLTELIGRNPGSCFRKPACPVPMLSKDFEHTIWNGLNGQLRRSRCTFVFTCSRPGAL